MHVFCLFSIKNTNQVFYLQPIKSTTLDFEGAVDRGATRRIYRIGTTLSDLWIPTCCIEHMWGGGFWFFFEKGYDGDFSCGSNMLLEPKNQIADDWYIKPY